MTTIINQLARQSAANAKRRERERVAQAKRVERERQAQKKRAIAEANRLQKQREAAAKKAERERMAQVKRLEKEHKDKERKTMADAKRLEKEHKDRERERKAKLIGQKKSLAEQRSNEGVELLESMENILNHALSVENSIDWELLKLGEPFGEPKPKVLPKPNKTILKEVPHEPKAPESLTLPPFRSRPSEPEPLVRNKPIKPNFKNEKYQPKFGFFTSSKKKNF